MNATMLFTKKSLQLYRRAEELVFNSMNMFSLFIHQNLYVKHVNYMDLFFIKIIKLRLKLLK